MVLVSLVLDEQPNIKGSKTKKMVIAEENAHTTPN
jgi:hypothetical protein